MEGNSVGLAAALPHVLVEQGRQGDLPVLIAAMGSELWNKENRAMLKTFKEDHRMV